MLYLYSEFLFNGRKCGRVVSTVGCETCISTIFQNCLGPTKLRVTRVDLNKNIMLQGSFFSIYSHKQLWNHWDKCRFEFYDLDWIYKNTIILILCVVIYNRLCSYLLSIWFRMKVPPLIRTKQEVKEKIQLIEVYSFFVLTKETILMIIS